MEELKDEVDGPPRHRKGSGSDHCVIGQEVGRTTAPSEKEVEWTTARDSASTIDQHNIWDLMTPESRFHPTPPDVMPGGILTNTHT